MNLSMNRIPSIWRRMAALVIVVAVSGCGGGGSIPAAKGTGKAVFTMKWPDRSSRLIPLASNSIRIVFKDSSNTTVGDQILVRPQTQATFNNLPIGNLVATATAFPNND